MPRIFTITAATESIELAEGGGGEITFTAANSSGRPQRAMARLMPLGSTKGEWLSLGGEVERDFPTDGVHQFVANVAPPAGTPAGRYTFRLDVVSVRNPDVDFTEGPTVAFEVKPVKVNGKPFPWWIVAVVAGVVVVGVVAYLLLRPGNAVPDPAATPVAIEVNVEVPNVVRRPFNDAKTEIEGRQLTVERLAPAVATLEFTPEEVVRQDPAVGTKVKPGTVVKLSVAGPSVQVPRVVGATLLDALQRIGERELVIGAATGNQNERVQSVSPPPDTVVLKGSKVAIRMPGPPGPIDLRAVERIRVRDTRIFFPALTPRP